MLHVCALSTVLGVKITMVLPNVEHYARCLFEGTITPVHGTPSLHTQISQPLIIMWTRCSLDNNANIVFTPDHALASVKYPKSTSSTSEFLKEMFGWNFYHGNC